MNERMVDELTEVFEHLASTKKIRFICLKSSSDNFCSGADFNWMATDKDQSYDESHEGSLKLYNMFNTIAKMPIPVISAVSGAVYGGGLGLLAISDYVIAEKDTHFCFSELKLGLLPATISPFVIRKIGYSAANALFLSGRRFNSEYALNIHLIHQISNNLEADLHSLLDSFRLTAPTASIQCKEMTQQINDGVSDEKHYTAGLITRARRSEEGIEGIDALLDKRKPAWVNRSKSTEF
jgi:methylglutaconyl-CoA hydratase